MRTAPNSPVSSRTKRRARRSPCGKSRPPRRASSVFGSQEFAGEIPCPSKHVRRENSGSLLPGCYGETRAGRTNRLARPLGNRPFRTPFFDIRKSDPKAAQANLSANRLCRPAVGHWLRFSGSEPAASKMALLFAEPRTTVPKLASFCCEPIRKHSCSSVFIRGPNGFVFHAPSKNTPATHPTELIPGHPPHPQRLTENWLRSAKRRELRLNPAR